MSSNQHSKFPLIPLNHEWIIFLPKICAKDATYSSSCVGIAKFGCHEVWNYFTKVIPLTHSDLHSDSLQMISPFEAAVRNIFIFHMTLFWMLSLFYTLISKSTNRYPFLLHKQVLSNWITTISKIIARTLWHIHWKQTLSSLNTSDFQTFPIKTCITDCVNCFTVVLSRYSKHS